MSKNIHHKRTFISWLAIYPLITILLWLLGDLLIILPLPLRTLLLTALLVPAMSYVVIPFYSKLFKNWLKE
ncbi:hypothetical protein [Chondrinema litorale]|uniref:hypothetical protein n=1 Tax=Chondrinema litorale TaxID=2994555 RepID=UPI000C40CADA|nr:hypothetical protein [Chondrinema litorale]MBT33137.1 hypothetical protein [Thalassovita sp.]UZR99060.1 hypothetical protein OQ292_34895 [Chondrinema litorale]